MTTKEIKSEIHKALDNIPENALKIILEYLKELEGKTADQIKLAKNLRDILHEDKELLERLAK
jgi:mRNA-degrading endonuclease RelE of RelBE toxin-antitoxin system